MIGESSAVKFGQAVFKKVLQKVRKGVETKHVREQRKSDLTA